MFSLSSSFLIRFLSGLLVLSIFVSFFYSCKKDSKENENEDIVTLLGIGLYARSCVGQNTFPSSGNVGTLTRLQISPTQTSSAINSYNTPHQVYLPQSGVSRKNILSIFYPGTGSSPCEIGAILQQGATRGYHIIGLSYPNNEAVNSVCNQGDAKFDAGCFENLRREVITGADVSPYVSVDASNSIEGRLLSLLQYLVQTRPGEGWEQFVTGNNINWSLVYVGGHSQGSGHAAFHGKIRAVARVSVYSGVSDYSLQFATIPTWMGGAQTAPAGSYYGLIHENDTVANFSGNPNQVTDAWLNQFSMTGSLTNTSVGSPFANSKRLVTSGCNGMGSAALHSCPMINGFQSIWNYISYP
ncbi:BPSS1187 family protein [Leptospira terpstrae]|uniref:BPSS1187 family protein n=1 Tax=Leptospira terpstrae TaxID=293075 RepID=UPI003D065688